MNRRVDAPACVLTHDRGDKEKGRPSSRCER